MNIMKCGTEVSIKNTSFRGFIVAITIKPGGYSYNVGYSSGDALETGVFYEFEIEPIGEPETHVIL